MMAGGRSGRTLLELLYRRSNAIPECYGSLRENQKREVLLFAQEIHPASGHFHFARSATPLNSFCLSVSVERAFSQKCANVLLWLYVRRTRVQEGHRKLGGVTLRSGFGDANVGNTVDSLRTQRFLKFISVCKPMNGAQRTR
jgi:hypothetical protein